MAALIKAVRKLPVALRRSLTWDRVAEITNHVQFTIATDAQVYFCNGLLRQYYPNGTDLSTVSQAQLDTVARKLTPRSKTLI